MTRRNFRDEIAVIGCLILLFVFGLSRTIFPLFSTVEAQESAELSVDGEIAPTLLLPGPGHPYDDYRDLSKGEIPSGQIVIGNEEEFFGTWEITGELRQAIIDTVKAVLARETANLFQLSEPQIVIDSLKSFSVEVRFTNGIPICPYCRVPTERSEKGPGGITCMYFPPIYDKYGTNTNPDRNISTSGWECLKCGKFYTVKGNSIDGWRYGE